MEKAKVYAKYVAVVLGFVVLIGGALFPGFKDAVCGGAPVPVASPAPAAAPSGQ